MEQEHAPAKEATAPKSKTLYVKNLNQKVKLFFLRDFFWHEFSRFGEVLAVHMKQNFRMRGQAFVVFREQEAADNALQMMNGALFCGK